MSVDWENHETCLVPGCDGELVNRLCGKHKALFHEAYRNDANGKRKTNWTYKNLKGTRALDQWCKDNARFNLTWTYVRH